MRIDLIGEPSTVRASGIPSASSISGMAQLSANSADWREVGTQRTRRPVRTRAPSSRMNSDEARPEPIPMALPSATNSRARS